MAKLRIVQGADPAKELVLKPTTSIGRRPDSDICVNSSLVSRDHCVIFENRGTWLVKDLGSTNGTYVNGVLARETILRPGDEVTIGPLTFLVQYDSATVPQAAAPEAVAAAPEAVAVEPEVVAAEVVTDTPEETEAAAAPETNGSSKEPAPGSRVPPKLPRTPNRAKQESGSINVDAELNDFLARFEQG